MTDPDELIDRAKRLIRGAFRRDGERLSYEERPRFSIPCRPAHDDDTALIDGIERLASERDAALQRLADLGQEWDAAPSLTPRDTETRHE